MPILTAIVGLPASGRMYYAKERQRMEGGLIVEMGSEAGEFERRLLPSIMLDGRDIFFVDATLCNDETKAAFDDFVSEFKEYKINWVYFANDLVTCLSNAGLSSPRHYQGIQTHIRGANKMYKIPDGVKQIPIFDQKSGKIDE